jgi:vacuolar protein sorting-associated protein 13A/C
MNISRWEGKIDLKNVKIKQELLTLISRYLGLPLFLRLGVIGELGIKIPWTKIWKDPVKLVLKDLIIVCESTGDF